MVTTSSYETTPNYETWAKALIAKLAMIGKLGTRPASSERWQWLIAWAQLEDTRARFNPLATTLYLPKSTVFNYAGVRSYPTLEDGVDAVVRTLVHAHSDWGYARIIDALRKLGSEFADFRHAVSDSAWSGLPRDGYHYLIPDYDPSWAERTLPT